MKLKTLKYFLLLIIVSLPHFTNAQDSYDWSTVANSQSHQGQVPPFPGMRTLTYKMACVPMGRHCEARVELSWELKNGEKKTQTIFEEMADSLSTLRVKKNRLILKAGYWADGNPLAKNDYIEWTYWRFQWKPKSNEFVEMK